MSKKPAASKHLIAQNRKARHDYTILETIEAGIVLTGSEVKSLRVGKASIKESYASEEGGEIFLINADISEYPQAGRFNHHPKRHRKLLFHRREISKLIGAINRKGMTLVPLSLYFNKDGRVKLELGLAKGKTKVDKRESEKTKDWKRQQARIMKDQG